MAKMKILLSIIVLISILTTSVVFGKVIYVDYDASGTNDGSSWEDAYIYLQAAIDDANGGDVVIVAPGIYTGEGNRDIDFKGKAITVRSIDPNDPNIVSDTIIDCQGNEGEYNRGFKVYSDNNENAILDGIKVINGYKMDFSDKGGGIQCASSGIVRNCIVTNNTSSFSGGVDITSNGIVTNCIIHNNDAKRTGGGVGVYNSGCLINSIITHNTASSGGGIVITDNGIVRNCIISNNSAGRYDFFNENYGGGILASHGDPLIINCTIVGNRANSQGGGIACGYRGVATMTNCILVYNRTDWGLGNQISTGPPSIVPVTILMTNNCCISNEENDSFTMEDTLFSRDNINEDPLFAKPGYWANSSDPNLIAEPNEPDAIWIDGDYHLKSQAGRWDPVSESWVVDYVTSPCIDAGDPNNPVGDEPEPNGGRINMGAYGGTAEASKSFYGE